MVEIYGLVDPRDQSIRYIGKANDTRKRLAGHLRDARRRSTPVYAWIRKLAGLGLVPTATVLERVDAGEWQAVEQRLIAEHKPSGRLLNVAAGGDEPHCPVEVRRANAERLNARRSNRAATPDDDLYGYWKMMREAGSSLRFMRQRGRTDVAERLERSLTRMRGLAKAQKAHAGRMWLERHP